MNFRFQNVLKSNNLPQCVCVVKLVHWFIDDFNLNSILTKPIFNSVSVV